MLNRKFVSHVSLGLFLGALAFAASSVYGAQTSKDSSEVSGLLAEAKTEAAQLKVDAEEFRTFTRSQLNWKTHAAKVDEIKQHVNKSGELLAKLTNARQTASPWQQQAIDRIEPLLKDLAATVETTIDHLSKHPEHLQTGPYKGYVDANADLASKLAEVISDYVEYGKSKVKSEELAAKLEVPEN